MISLSVTAFLFLATSGFLLAYKSQVSKLDLGFAVSFFLFGATILAFSFIQAQKELMMFFIAFVCSLGLGSLCSVAMKHIKEAEQKGGSETVSV